MKSQSQACAALLLGALAFCSAACGSDDNGYSDGNYSNQAVASNQANQVSARYLGTGALSNGQAGNLDMNVDAQGNATGTFTVVNALVNALTDGSYPVSGLANLNTGAFRLTGSNLTITGLLPGEDNLGQYAVDLAGQIFSGILQSPSLALGSPESGRTRSILSGTQFNLNFQAMGYNGVNPPIGNNPVFGGLYTTGTANNTLLIALTQPGTAPGNYRLLNFGVNTHGNSLKLGTYPLVTSGGGDGAFFNLTDTTGSTLNAAWAPSGSSSGSIKVNTIISTEADLEYNFQNVGPNPRSPGSAQGSFNISGHVQVFFSN